MDSQPGSTADDNNPFQVLRIHQGIQQHYSPTEGMPGQEQIAIFPCFDVLPQPVNTFLHAAEDLPMGVSG